MLKNRRNSTKFSAGTYKKISLVHLRIENVHEMLQMLYFYNTKSKGRFNDLPFCVTTKRVSDFKVINHFKSYIYWFNVLFFVLDFLIEVFGISRIFSLCKSVFVSLQFLFFCQYLLPLHLFHVVDQLIFSLYWYQVFWFSKQKN